MGRPAKLDQQLLKKIAEATENKSLQYVREQVDKRANRLTVSPQVAQLIWAGQLGLPIASRLAALPPELQAQVRAEINAPRSSATKNPSAPTPQTPIRQQDPISDAAHYLISDIELSSRCGDLLRRNKHLDRVMREATTVLEDRIRNLSGIVDPLRPEELVNTAINPDPSKAILVFGNQPSQQQGLHAILRGIVLTIRHQAHHRLSDQLTREDALKFTLFVDMLLQLLSTTTRRAPPP